MAKYYEAYEKRYRQVHEKQLSWASNQPSPIVLETIEKYTELCVKDEMKSGIIIYGNIGYDNTYLAASVANKLIENNKIVLMERSSSIIDRIYWSTGQFVLGAISGTLAVAVFSVAITLQQMYMTFSGAISNVLLPRIVKIVHNNKSTSELSSIFIKAGRLQAIIMLLVLFGFIVFGKKFIEYWAGDGYIESFYIALLFFFSLFIPLVQSVGFCILQAKNCLKFRSLSYLIIAIVSLLGQIILSKEYGAIGCSIAISFALLLGQGLIMNFYYQKYQQLNIISFWKEILKLAIFPFMLSFLWVILDLNKFLVHSIGTLLVGMSIFTLIYIIGKYYISMNKDEQYYIISAGKYLKKKYAK